MEEQQLKEPPLGFKRQIIKIFFEHISERSWDINNYLIGFKNRGYDTDCFYWMDPVLKPTLNDLERILVDQQYGLTELEIKNYTELYKRHYKPDDGLKSEAA